MVRLTRVYVEAVELFGGDEAALLWLNTPADYLPDEPTISPLHLSMMDIAALYEVERKVRDLEPDVRRRISQEKAAPLMDAFHAWMIAQRERVHEGLGITKALDYSLIRWAALSRYLNDGTVPIDNNHIEQQIRPWDLGRKNWLFAGSLRSRQRAAALMSLIHSAKLNGHDAYAYLKDVLTRLPTQRASEIEGLLPHRWQPS